MVVLVSEETGAISVAVDGKLRRHLSAETLEKFLRNELLPQGHEAERRRGLRDSLAGLKDKMVRNGAGNENK